MAHAEKKTAAGSVVAFRYQRAHVVKRNKKRKTPKPVQGRKSSSLPASTTKANLFDRATSMFAGAGVDTTSPGFDLSPAFLRAEGSRGTQEMLATYAEFVAGRPRTAAYDARARALVPQIARRVHAMVEADSRQGACVDASMAISRMLDQVGIFNVVVKGALTVGFPDGLEPRYFWHFNGPAAPVAAGHAWVYAPPFEVVDATLTRQGWELVEQALMVEPVIAEACAAAHPTVEDLFDPEVRPRAHAERGSVERYVRSLGCYRVQCGRLVLKYTACGVGMSDGPLEGLRTPIGGKDRGGDLLGPTRPAGRRRGAPVAAHDAP